MSYFTERFSIGMEVSGLLYKRRCHGKRFCDPRRLGRRKTWRKECFSVLARLRGSSSIYRDNR